MKEKIHRIFPFSTPPSSIALTPTQHKLSSPPELTPWSLFNPCLHSQLLYIAHHLIYFQKHQTNVVHSSHHVITRAAPCLLNVFQIQWPPPHHTSPCVALPS